MLFSILEPDSFPHAVGLRHSNTALSALPSAASVSLFMQDRPSRYTNMLSRLVEFRVAPEMDPKVSCWAGSVPQPSLPDFLKGKLKKSQLTPRLPTFLLIFFSESSQKGPLSGSTSMLYPTSILRLANDFFGNAQAEGSKGLPDTKAGSNHLLLPELPLQTAVVPSVLYLTSRFNVRAPS